MVSGEYICARHGILTTELVYFDANEEGERSGVSWAEGLGHQNGGLTNYNNLTQKEIERRATFNRVTHWQYKPEVPEQLSTSEFYKKLKGELIWKMQYLKK